MTIPRRFLRIGCSVIALLLWAVVGTAAEKTDVVYLRNGDRVTCEIKNLQRGQLKVKTDSIGTIYIEWKDIVRVTSKELYVVELEDGSRLQGTLAATDAEATLLLDHEGSTQVDRHEECRLARPAQAR